MISVDEAWERIQREAQAVSGEARSLADAAGYVLADSVSAPQDLPPFSNSAMDGFALKAADTVEAAETLPVSLPVTGEVAAGSGEHVTLTSGTAVKIMTGAPLPAGADSVLQLECGRFRQGQVEIRSPLVTGTHVRQRGEDVRIGEPLVASGTRLQAQQLGLLANSGIHRVSIHRPLRARVLATGSELIASDQTLAPGQIYDSNRLVLQRFLDCAGCKVDDLGIVPDEPSAIADRIREGLRSDLLLISGGVSVGEHDHVKNVLRELGVHTLFWRVQMKPGKPIFCGRAGDCWIFGLPGNPISCVVGFLVFVQPLIRVLQGEVGAQPAYQRARLTSTVAKKDHRRTFMTARLSTSSEGMLDVTATAKQGSAMMQALGQANAFIVVPEARMRIESGEEVDVLPING